MIVAMFFAALRSGDDEVAFQKWDSWFAAEICHTPVYRAVWRRGLIKRVHKFHAWITMMPWCVVEIEKMIGKKIEGERKSLGAYRV
jgi:hypothetical protein